MELIGGCPENIMLCNQSAEHLFWLQLIDQIPKKPFRQ
jgi:hypothetical protein